MKKRKLKLSFEKETVAKLQDFEMGNVQGGASDMIGSACATIHQVEADIQGSDFPTKNDSCLSLCNDVCNDCSKTKAFGMCQMLLKNSKL